VGRKEITIIVRGGYGLISGAQRPDRAIKENIRVGERGEGDGIMTASEREDCSKGRGNRVAPISCLGGGKIKKDPKDAGT